MTLGGMVLKKILIFPINEENHYWRSSSDLLNNVVIGGLVAEKNSAYVGKTYNAGNDIIKDEWKSDIKECDEIILFPGNISEERYKEIIDAGKDLGKPIIATDEAWKNIPLEYQAYVAKFEMPHIECEIPLELHDIDVPIITVMSLGEHAGKFEIQLELKRYFESKGYNLLQFSTKEFGEMFNMKLFPDFMKKEMSMPTKIKLFNEYIYRMTKEYPETDLIVIGIPGGIYPHNKIIDNSYGELAAVVSKAVQIDINIMSIYCVQDLLEKDLEEISDYTYKVFNCQTEFFNISNTFGEYEYDGIGMQYHYYDKKILQAFFEKPFKTTLFNAYYNINVKDAVEKMEQELLANYEVI